MKNKELFICITENKTLHSIEYDNNSKDYFSLCGSSYNNPISEKQGKQEAKDRMSDSDYWEEIGYLPDINRQHNFLYDFIDFEEVAERVILMDGWQNVNGEYQNFGTLKNSYGEEEEFYLTLSGCGQDDSWKDEKVVKWLVPEKECKKLLALWKKYHLKKTVTAMKSYNEVKRIFSEYEELQDRQKVLEEYNQYSKSLEAEE